MTRMILKLHPNFYKLSSVQKYCTEERSGDA